MKKIFLSITCLFVALVLVACGGDTFVVTFDSNNGSTVASIEVSDGKTFAEPAKPVKNGYDFLGWFKDQELKQRWNFATDKVTENITLYAKWEIAGDEGPQVDLKGIDFVIMVDNSLRADPRSDQYERLFQEEKAERIAYVEQKYNINVVYQTYPSSASWGGARERFIVSQTTSGKPAHIFEITNTSMGTLAQQGVISPLNQYIEKYGVEGYWQNKLELFTIQGNVYAYDDIYNNADDGLYYNPELLASVLGKENAYLPTEMWNNGEWTWDAFKELAVRLNEELDENKSAAEGGPQYVLGGRTYNWFYNMLGTNGAKLVSGDFKTHLTTEPVIETLNYMNELYLQPGMWRDESPLDNSVEPEFRSGNIVFHNGQSWYPTVSSKWKDLSFNLEFVPYPVGPRAGANLENYNVNNVTGSSGYVISSYYDKANIPEGYENTLIHDETIFRIWADMQYFPNIDSETNEISLEEVKSNFESNRLFANYGTQASIDAHLSIFGKVSADFFYFVPNSQAHVESGYQIKIQSAIREGDVRTKMEAIEAALRADFIDQFKLDPNFYN